MYDAGVQLHVSKYTDHKYDDYFYPWPLPVQRTINGIRIIG